MKTLLIVTGPTASGKTKLAIELARALDTEIVSADSRQIFRGLPIGTASPTREELSAVRHHLVGVLDLHEYYSAAKFEEDALGILSGLWEKNDYAVMCGGSMMYIDAITRGIDDLPTISPEIRSLTLDLYNKGGLPALHEKLRQLDPDYLASCDLSNHRRLIHAIEICLQAGVPYSTLRTGTAKTRPFRIIKFAIDWPREELFSRINSRGGTLGYKEMGAMMDGLMPRDVAIARIAKNTRVYAKKQLLWLSKDPSVVKLDPKQPLLPQALSVIRGEGI